MAIQSVNRAFILLVCKFHNTVKVNLALFCIVTLNKLIHGHIMLIKTIYNEL